MLIDSPATLRSSALSVPAAQAALDLLPALAVVAADGTILDVNAAWTAFINDNGGTEAACGRGVNYLQVCDAASGPASDEAAPVAAGLRAVLAGERADYTLTYPCHTPVRQRWYRVHVRPFAAQGERLALVMHEDVTALKLSEIRASDVEAEITQGVRRKTAALRQENRELDAFIGGVSHDLRTPLRHLRGFLEVLRRQAAPRLTESDVRLLEVLDGAAERLGRMVDELLGLARASQTALQVRDVHLAQVVMRAWFHLAPETQGREIDWVAGDLPVVRGDPELLTLAFENLLSNAVKYTAGRARARIEVGARDEEEAWVVFVQDDGVGFDPRYKDRLFGAFQRLHHEREFQGIGLGLANVRRVMIRHGAEVWGESHPGDGATFYVRFPKTPSIP
ncbi:sensor histidine kinase [Deinococcus koreensis]|uniref:sensor histidine kinase n=1 Tax=Deinococcus koreensis TaxID=2054903 RepID=UPI00105744C6|nr:HAMP domain-containing sensor histidine kinase [Deinococcus koreensis]